MEINAFLEEIHIEKFLSLRNVTLPLNQLTILVGPNASGKSNTLRSLRLLNQMMNAPQPPGKDIIENYIWAGVQDTLNKTIDFKLKTKIDDVNTSYQLQLQPLTSKEIFFEHLTVAGNEIISVQEGVGKVRDEMSPFQETEYNPSQSQIALKSAGDYGHKPITRSLKQFISGWEFYNFEPQQMRESNFIFINPKLRDNISIENIDDDGSALRDVLISWILSRKDLFDAVSESLEQCTNLRIEPKIQKDNEVTLYLQEGYNSLIPLERASDGTLRLIAYYILLNQPNIPPLIAIEEPERNLHPGALLNIATVLEKLAKKTQVIITTHSSQLLDSFNYHELSKTLGVILMHNVKGSGTQVMNLEQARADRKAVDGWIADFGIGSAIFDSELLQDYMGA